MEHWSRVNYIPNLPLGENGQRVTGSKKHIELSRYAAEEGIVLLKNENSVLPLKKGCRIALFGKATFDYVKGGGGSGDVTVSYIRTLYDGLISLDGQVSIFDGSVDFYRRYVQEQYACGKAPGMLAEPVLPQKLVKEGALYGDIAIISLSRFSGEGWDRKEDYYLSSEEKEMITQVSTAFSKVIVALNVGGLVDTSWFKDNKHISAVLMVWQGGMEGGTAIARILTGLVNPSGKLSDTLAASLDAYPSSDTFWESEDYVDYFEDIYVGYRYFETISNMKEKVNYPFGFGLSYTTFELRDGKAAEQNGNIIVNVWVINTGHRAGKEVVQVYVEAPQGKLGKAARSLTAFKKTRLLQPGEAQYIELSFELSELASYDDLGKVQESAMILEKGEYKFYLGTDVRSAEKMDFTITLEENIIVRQLARRLAPSALSKRLLADGTYEELKIRKENVKIGHPELRISRDETPLFQPNVRSMTGMPFDQRYPGHIYLQDVADGKNTLQELIDQLSDEDLCYLVGGQPNTGVANTFGYGNLPAFGIPNVMTADGPAGLRIYPEAGIHTTAFPCATQIACTWNTEIAEAIGYAGGAEVKENNIGVWLTPAINIHRNAFCGRNFEYYSEDPYLTGKMAGAMVRGIQSNHIGASVKHFALNNKETNRKNSDSRCSERAIREIYLKAFEIIVKEEKPWTIMSSYNLINGQRASENQELLTGILREEWGFQGMVTSDWWTNGEHLKEVKAGNDVKMAQGFPDELMKALSDGRLSRGVLETSAVRILNMILKLD